MSLVSALNLGSSALAAQQAAIQVTGNNIANASNPDFTRQTAQFSASPDHQIGPGLFVGTGVTLDGVTRQIDEALSARLRSSHSDAAAASTNADWLSRVETTFNALSGQDLGSQLNSFFNDWSTLANNPQDEGQRQVVLQDGQSLANQFNHVSTQLGQLLTDGNSQLQSLVQNADSLSTDIARLNVQIAASSTSSGSNNGLADQRDADLKQLSQLINIQTIPQENGTVNVYAGSDPLILAGQSQGLTTKQLTINNQLVTSVVLKSDGGTIPVTSGRIGALINVQGQIQDTGKKLDTLAGGFIFELNKVHSGGQGIKGYQNLTATNAVSDPTLALNDLNTGLKASATNGSFVVHVTSSVTGLSNSTLVPVNLSGQGTQTSLNSLVASLNGVGGISASIVGGKLQLKTTNNLQTVSFSQDSSGVLASLGLNTFFTGSTAADIGINQQLVGQPALLAASANGDAGDNTTAKAIAALQKNAVPSLGGVSVTDHYQSIITGIASATASAKTNATATQSVTDTLESQKQALSGVSIEEETVHLLQQQHAFQAAAKLVSTVNDLLNKLMNIL